MPIHDWTRVSAGTFHHFHTAWITELSRALNNGRLPPDYYALAEQQAGDVGPDVITLHSPRRGGNGSPTSTAGSPAGTPPRSRFTAEIEIDVYADKRRTLVIRHTSDDRVVALLEILSPGNKASRSKPDQFIDKAVNSLRQCIHLLVVDLLPPGKFDPEGIHGAIWSELGDDSFALPDDKRLTLAAYAASVTIKAFIEPIAVGDQLPSVPLFLEFDRYVEVPLEETYCAALETMPQHLRQALMP